MSAPDRWEGAADYESYVGRWSRLVAPRFVAWLSEAPGRAWLDVGCGTGALTAAIAAGAEPASIVAVDQSASFVGAAAEALGDAPATFITGDAMALPLASAHVDVAVSGLLLNFLPDADAAVAELLRVARPGATVAAYVWDYAEGMQPIRAFWDAALAVDEAARSVDEAVRFPLCDLRELQSLWERAGLRDVRVEGIEVGSAYRDFEEYWAPFLTGVGPAPGYCAALAPEQREAVRERLQAALGASAGGSVAMTARAFAVRGGV